MIGGPIDGETISSPTATFIWEGNESASEYRIKFDIPTWSDWISVTSHTFEYLDEGNHSFEIQARSVNGDKQADSLHLEFVVDALEGPAFVLHPYHQVSEVGDTITVRVQLLDVERVFALGLDLSFPMDTLSFVDYSVGEISDEWGGQSLSIVDFRQNSSEGNLSIALTVVEGNPSGYTGSIHAISFRFVVENPGTLWLNPQHIQIVNSDGQAVSINASRGTRIDAQ